MKKLLLAVLVSGAAITLASCGGNNTSDSKSTEPTYDTTVLEDTEHDVCVAGPHDVKVDGEWTTNAWKFADDKSNFMTATSVAAVKEVSKDVADALNTKELKNLYMIDIRLGASDAGYLKRAKIDGKVYTANGSFTLKSIYGHFDEETEVYVEDQWVSDPKLAYVESLTPTTLFYPTWQEEPDEDGFAWDQDPVCIGGAGVYTYVIAQYKNASSEGNPGYGAALVKKEAYDGEGKQEYVLEVAFADHTWGICGSLTNWGNGKEDIALTKEDNNTFSVTHEFAVDDEWKIRADSAWGSVYGAADLGEVPEGAFTGTDNIKVVTAGKYKVTLKNTNGKVKINIAAA